MNIIRYFTLFTIFSGNTYDIDIDKDKDKLHILRFKESLVFFFISAFICIICIYLTILLYRNEYFLQKVIYKNKNNDNDNDNDNDIKYNQKCIELIEMNKIYNDDYFYFLENENEDKNKNIYKVLILFLFIILIIKDKDNYNYNYNDNY
jgi:hypothetical protein